MAKYSVIYNEGNLSVITKNTDIKSEAFDEMFRLIKNGKTNVTIDFNNASGDDIITAEDLDLIAYVA